MVGIVCMAGICGVLLILDYIVTKSEIDELKIKNGELLNHINFLEKILKDTKEKSKEISKSYDGLIEKLKLKENTIKKLAEEAEKTQPIKKVSKTKKAKTEETKTEETKTEKEQPKKRGGKPKAMKEEK